MDPLKNCGPSHQQQQQLEIWQKSKCRRVRTLLKSVMAAIRVEPYEWASLPGGAHEPELRGTLKRRLQTLGASTPRPCRSRRRRSRRQVEIVIHARPPESATLPAGSAEASHSQITEQQPAFRLCNLGVGISSTSSRIEQLVAVLSRRAHIRTLSRAFDLLFTPTSDLAQDWPRSEPATTRSSFIRPWTPSTLGLQSLILVSVRDTALDITR